MSKKLLAQGKTADKVFTGLVYLAALFVFVVLVGIIVSLVVESIPGFKAFGFSFLVNSEWQPSQNKFGALVPIVGTLVTSFIALLIATPVSFFTAIFIVYICPNKLKGIIKNLLELLAAVPSIVFGMFGLMVFAPVFSEYFQIPLQNIIGNVPFIGALVAGPAWGLGLLPAGIILSIMVIPFITSTMTDIFNQSPKILLESAYGMGLTRWESINNIIVPSCRVGLVSGVMLGLGRALGETMAVAFVIGNTFNLNGISLYQPLSTITSVIANDFAEASEGLYISVLLELGLILFVITFFVLLISKAIIKFSARKDGK
ncbi:phosphate ABC transporter permease subunit PstC [Psittacicella melopsittaci]|uniref:Phosphate transport system permease protein n=1 Tax=Psittacicella melopsittaci TaxID=2028576 RepID=A0A3A1Y7H7_9GAMM|nr:phosphate ABC transporter permease subunit PstC [Psittacicella melopsittaci]RIY32024.1 phosphate ABC transporter permease subunit PstC [Psittacicella melopsittaci]